MKDIIYRLKFLHSVMYEEYLSSPVELISDDLLDFFIVELLKKSKKVIFVLKAAGRDDMVLESTMVYTGIKGFVDGENVEYDPSIFSSAAIISSGTCASTSIIV